MSKVPCRECPKCGVYHDVSVTVCDACQANIKHVPAYAVEADTIPADKKGTINEKGTFYVQHCPACGTLNFIADKDQPVKYCFSCDKVAIKKREPIVYVDETAPTVEEKEPTVWQQAQENIENAMGKEPTTEQDVEVPTWGVLPSDTADKTPSRITLTAVRGNCSFTVEETETYTLGRDAMQAAFLAWDRRVGHKHCTLLFKDGAWWVKDEDTKNGTFVDATLLDVNGVERLYDGCTLILGHNPDSPAFRVTVQ